MMTDLIEKAEKWRIISQTLFAKYIYIDEDVLTSDETTDKEIIAGLTGKKNDNIDVSYDDEEINTEQKTCVIK